MGINTDIQWADSTLNLQIGCDGCELWNPKAGVKICYAGKLTEHWGGKKGWPKSFSEPKLFLERLEPALRWPDFTGTTRLDKPWLNGLPRLIFLDDMGDTFTESLPLEWLAPLLPRMADSPHQMLLLTKRANRMEEFSKLHPFPPNFWLMTSITCNANANRIAHLLRCQGGSVRGISYEPATELVDFFGPGEILGNNYREVGKVQGLGADGEPWFVTNSGRSWSAFDVRFRPQRANGLNWIIVGGSSGFGAQPFDMRWARHVIGGGAATGTRVFFKQAGSNPVDKCPRCNGRGTIDSWQDGMPGQEECPAYCYGCGVPIKLKDSMGGDWNEWEKRMCVREFPVPAEIR